MENFKDLFEASLKETEMRLGKVIRGTVVVIDSEFVWVDAALKSESIIPIGQFKNSNGEVDVVVGDHVDVVLEHIDNNMGETRLSREKAKRLEIWTALEHSCDAEENIIGRITSHVRGGYTVDVKGLKGFLPGSLVDVRPLRDISHLENKDIEFRIIKLDPKRNNIVVSRRAVVEADTKEEREALLEKLEEGAMVKGIVKNITDFGAFIDLGGIDGLLHITDMSWSRIKHPTDILEIGDELDVKIIKFDKEKGRISLGIKQLGDDPWKNVANELPVGTKLPGKVTNITDYGCFVKLQEGIEGLVHTSEMDWANKNSNPHKLVTLGQELEVMVLEVDADRHRISLGMKQCVINPWQAFSNTYKVGDKVKGVIRSITDFGVFVLLKPGIDGLVHVSDLSWTEHIEHPGDVYKRADAIEAIILGVDIDNKKISLGIKQLSENPWENIEQHYKVNNIIGCIICRTIDLLIGRQ